MELSFALISVWLPAILIFLIWLTPLVLIGRSDKVVAKEKVAWLVATIFISWFSWILFMLLAPIKNSE